MKGPVKALLATLLCVAAPAHAICTDLTALFQGADSISLLPPFGTKADCTTSLALSGKTSTHCAWPFAYRAPEAQQAFDALIAAVPACLNTTAVTGDQDVNHPDFYYLRLFDVPLGQVGVALKDKGSLQQTYVFLHVTPNK
ncbi:hypothetical protein N9M66_01570 [Litoreibacter sp.]|nr:hypothetical protein [Litoreibacter sp.]